MFLFKHYDPMAAVSGNVWWHCVCPYNVLKFQNINEHIPCILESGYHPWIRPLLNLQAKMDWDALLHLRRGEHSVAQLHLGQVHLAGKVVATRNDHACSRMHVGGWIFKRVGAWLDVFATKLNTICWMQTHCIFPKWHLSIPALNHSWCHFERQNFVQHCQQWLFTCRQHMFQPTLASQIGKEAHGHKTLRTPTQRVRTKVNIYSQKVRNAQASISRRSPLNRFLGVRAHKPRFRRILSHHSHHKKGLMCHLDGFVLLFEYPSSQLKWS